MKIRDLMTKTVACCRPETNLAAAGELMWQSDCGILPVIDEQNRVTGVLTDRDACIALTTRDRPASAMRVSDVVTTSRAVVCYPNDDVRIALNIMQDKKLHRFACRRQDGHARRYCIPE